MTGQLGLPPSRGIRAGTKEVFSERPESPANCVTCGLDCFVEVRAESRTEAHVMLISAAQMHRSFSQTF